MTQRAFYIIPLLLMTLTGLQAQVAITGLRCEQMINPQGIDARAPRLSWQITGTQRGILQTAYQVLVASSPETLATNKGDLWNSGKIAGDKSVLVPYKGTALKSRQSCYWKVKTWTTAGESDWSAAGSWSMGLLDAADWKARWIGYDQGFPWDSVSKFSRLSARYFRREFSANKPVRKATLYIIGLGHYEVYVNGSSIGDQVLAEAPTDYTRSVKYNTFDVTKECRPGMNAIGVVLGNGRFFTMRPKYKPQKIKEFGFPKLLFQLEITYADGTHSRVVSDERWRFTADGPIRTNNEYDGEEYDATKELGNWTLPGHDAAAWLQPQLVAPPGGRINAQMNDPIKVMALVKPVSITEWQPGKWILDMGQNMAGWVQMKVKGPAGQRVVLRYGETLQQDGALYTANLRDAMATDVYTLKGGETETWHPVFVFHGFRYVEITGYPGKPSVNDFEGQVIYDDLAATGQFRTDNELVNHIYQNARWGIAANYKGMPIDCPQRNERMPWLGDRTTGSLGESFVFDNGRLYAKWLDDIEEAQRSDSALPDVAPAYWNYYSDNMTWPGAYVLIADMLYKQFGDAAPIARHYASMKKWLFHMKRKYEQAGIMTKDKYGDWCVPPESPELIHSRDSSRITDGQLIATAYYYRILRLMEGFARQLHLSADALEYAKLAVITDSAFNRKFLDRTRGCYSNNTVTANLLPLYFGMTPPAYRTNVFAHIVEKIEKDDKGHISTGVIGTQWLMRGLSDYGRGDLAWKIVTNKDYPGWGYMVEHGATTIWELWNGDSAAPAMNSHNHVMLLGDLITWLYEDVAGIAADSPGCKTLVMRPYVLAAGAAAAAYQTPYGMVKSSWKKEGTNFTWNLSLPGNTRATVWLPAGDIQEGGHPLDQQIHVLRMEPGWVILELGSGDYHFKVNIK